MTKYLVALSILFTGAFSASAQTTDEELNATIRRADSLFWQAYNTCNIQGMEQFMTEDLEFYHDKGGYTVGRAAFSANTKKNLCSNPNFRLRREVLPESVKVFPLHKDGVIYGAIMSGVHVFYIIENNKPGYLDGEASFTHLWLKKDGAWKMSRVLSYDHHPANQKKQVASLTAAQIKQHEGKYSGPQTKSMNITAANDHLVMEINGKKFDLYPSSPSLFFMKERNLSLEFDNTGATVKENGEAVETLRKQ
jgi:hypothetical protein